ncbi:response regulator transcription factor [Marinococcus sp. PL1-022]|uniref:response regulator transcription factor n=1 Tax=Marinococcus sp. PL1-022 TaxID=3095363 RepID=UPI0029C2FB8D|nr:response regulator transcription factor [Marinococcus sp. PL1-022]MDX6152699.1 response regulator transcription factor [Marinococcus sp. PL1-022]
MNKILVIEDDDALNKIVTSHLRTHGYSVVSCTDANKALEELSEQMIDIIVSDIMMPGIDGFELAGSVRKLNKTMPILFISALDDLYSKKKGFRLDIDDYMVKPIELDELILRIQALIRRANIANDNQITIGKLVLDKDEMTIYLEKQEIPVTVREFHVLFKLLSYPKKTFTRLQLMDEFWGYETESESRSVDVYITKLRNKFKNNGAFEIVTVHGLGYKAVLHEEK